MNQLATNNYRSQLINEITEASDPILKQYFQENKDIRNYHHKTYKDCVISAISDYLEDDITLDYIKDCAKSLLNKRRQRAFRWKKKIEKDINTYDITDVKSIFYFLYQQYKYTTPENYSAIYSAQTPIEARDNLIAQMETWRKNNDYYIHLLLLNELGNINEEEFFLDDLRLQLTNYLIKNFDGDVNNLLFRKPLDIIENNPFSNRRSTLKKENVKENNEIEVYSSENNSYRVNIIPNSIQHTLRAFDAKDAEILNTLVNSAKINSTNGKVDDIYMSLYSLTSKILNVSNPNASQKKEIEERLTALVKNTVSVTKGEDTVVFNILDSVSITQESRGNNSSIQMVYIILGRTICENILQQKLISVPSAKYTSLISNTSKLLYHKLQLERLLMPEGSDYTKNYDYNFFADYLMLSRRWRKKNTEMIEEALKEFYEKQILIQNYEKHKNTYRITFYPVSETERNDFKEVMSNGTKQ